LFRKLCPYSSFVVVEEATVTRSGREELGIVLPFSCTILFVISLHLQRKYVDQMKISEFSWQQKKPSQVPYLCHHQIWCI
jgi:hypothetical protein